MEKQLRYNRNKFLVSLILVGVFLSLGVFTSIGQTTRPEVMLTWESSTYTPLGFRGKTLPTNGSLVTASLDILDSSGRLVDFSEETTYWYLNGKLIKSGVGIQAAVFRALRGTQELRVQLPDYPGGILVKTVGIPTVRPEVVITYGGVDGNIAGSARAEALTYFFNVSDQKSLDFFWQVNGQPPENLESPEFLNITLPSSAPDNFPVNVSLSVVNKNFTTEAASKLLRLTLKR